MLNDIGKQKHLVWWEQENGSLLFLHFKTQNKFDNIATQQNYEMSKFKLSNLSNKWERADDNASCRETTRGGRHNKIVLIHLGLFE